MYDNSVTARLVAERTAGKPVRTAEPELWGRIMKQMEAREEERAYRAEEGESVVMGMPVSARSPKRFARQGEPPGAATRPSAIRS